MIITAKFASVCPCCSSRIAVGSKVEWSKGSKAVHAACAGTSAPVASKPYVATARRSYTPARAGKWNGCSCGAREYADGTVSANACFSCRHDAE